MASHIIDVNANGLTAMDHAVSGAISGVVTRALVQPIDVLKIRFQVGRAKIFMLAI